MMSVRTTLEVEMQSSLMCNRHSHAPRAQNDVPAKDDLRAKLDGKKCSLRVRQRTFVEDPKQNGRRTADGRLRRMSMVQLTIAMRS
jgi:hypothetical protein